MMMLQISYPRTHGRSGKTLPTARQVSLAVHARSSQPSDSSNSHLLMQWGQFLDHDLTHTPVDAPQVWSECQSFFLGRTNLMSKLPSEG